MQKYLKTLEVSIENNEGICSCNQRFAWIEGMKHGC